MLQLCSQREVACREAPGDLSDCSSDNMLGLFSHICFLFYLTLGTFSFWWVSAEALWEPVCCSLGSGEDCTSDVILDWIFPVFSSWGNKPFKWLALPRATGTPLPGLLCTACLWFQLVLVVFWQKLGVLWPRDLQGEWAVVFTPAPWLRRVWSCSSQTWELSDLPCVGPSEQERKQALFTLPTC